MAGIYYVYFQIAGYVAQNSHHAEFHDSERKVPMASESKEFFIKLCLLSTCFFFINLFLYYPRFSDYPPFRGCKITQKSAVFQKNDF